MKVGPLQFEVRFVDGDDLDDAFGNTSYERHVIKVQGDLPKTGKQDTLLHECLHALMFAYGIRAALRLDRDDEEVLVRLLTPAILALWKDNPELRLDLL